MGRSAGLRAKLGGGGLKSTLSVCSTLATVTSGDESLCSGRDIVQDGTGPFAQRVVRLPSLNKAWLVTPFECALTGPSSLPRIIFPKKEPYTISFESGPFFVVYQVSVPNPSA